MTYQEVMKKLESTRAQVILKSYTEEQQKDLSYVYDILANTLLDTEYYFYQSKGSETDRLAIITLLHANLEGIQEVMENMCSFGTLVEIIETEKYDDEEEKQDIVDILESFYDFLDNFEYVSSLLPMSYSSVYRKMRELFAYKGNMSTVKRTLEDLEKRKIVETTFHGYIISPSILPYSLKKPLFK